MTLRTLLLLICAFPLTAFAADHPSPYRDPHNRFELTVPAGWKVTPLGDGVQIVRGDSYASVMLFEHASTASDLIDDLQSQIGKRWHSFEVTHRADSILSGQKAASLWATGVNPQGQPAALKMTALISGDVGFALLTGSPTTDPKTAASATLAEIERSFHLLESASAISTPAAQPTLGIEVTDPSADDLRPYQLDQPNGVLVLEIADGGPAQKAGVKLYDLMIAAGAQTIDSAATFQQIVRSHNIGDALELHLLRLGPDNKIRQITAALTFEAAPRRH